MGRAILMCALIAPPLLICVIPEIDLQNRILLIVNYFGLINLILTFILDLLRRIKGIVKEFDEL